MTDKPTPTTDLLKRCAEIHEWRSTGVLSGEALRDYAKRKWPDLHDTLQMAEHETVTEALALLAKWGQPAQAGEYPALVCDYCGALTPDPWHSSGMLHGKMSKHIHSCDACAALAAAPAQPAAEASRFGSPELQAMIIARCVEKDQADSVQEDADRYRWLRERSSTMFVNISINGVSIHARHH